MDEKPALSSRLKIPPGSLVVDGALVIALIWSQATATEVQRSFDVRLHNVEMATNNHADYEARISVIEATELSQDKNYEELKQDIVRRLDRIENKLDRIK